MRRFAFLDSLRGLAAVYVVLYHMTFVPTPNLSVPHWLTAFVMMGGTGVTLFFIISAFSLSYTITKHTDDSVGVAGFYIRRFFRIAPLFYVILVVTLFRDIYIFSAHHKVAEILENIFFIYNFIPGSQGGIVWASWTIGVEMIFYAIFPLLFKNLGNIHKTILLIVLSLLLTALFNEILFYLAAGEAIRTQLYTFNFFRHLPVFGFGMLSYWIFKTYILNSQTPRTLGILLIGIATYGYMSLGSGKLTIFFLDQYYWPAILYSCLALGLAIYPLPIIVNPLTTYLGRISYSVYLLHPLIVIFLRPLYKFIYSLRWPTTVHFVVCAAVTLLTLVITASITYGFIEEPGIRLGKTVLAWLSKLRSRETVLPLAPSGSEPAPGLK